MSPAPNTTITLYVDPTLKGAGIRRDDGDYRPGCWVALIARRSGGAVRHVESLRLTQAVKRSDAEVAVRQHLGIPRRTLKFLPTSSDEKAWTVDLHLSL